MIATPLDSKAGSARRVVSKSRRIVSKSARAARIVGIGASAGGLEAFTELVRQLPVDAGFAYVLVQHLDPSHPSLLSELLAKSAPIPVDEIADHTPAAANRIYVIPPNCDLAIQGGVLILSPRVKNAGPARSIDHFLQSLAADQGADAIGIILSGAGSDGAEGLKAIKDAGGVTFVQDATSAKYDSMPRSAIATGCVDFVLNPAKIAAEIAGLAQRPQQTRRRAAANARNRRTILAPKVPMGAGVQREPSPWPAPPEDLNLRKIFLLLRTRAGIDFGLYRLNTIRRRLARRISLHRLKGIEAYGRFLREHPAELDALYQDLLINVTSFFRNPSVFDMLQRKIFPRLVKNGALKGDVLRVWVAGCSTGQEPYSIAMAYSEFAEKTGTHIPIQIFASDVNPAVLEQARAGRYPRSQVQNLSAARLQRFFTREHDRYSIQKPIREMVIFAQQNLLADPPFTRVDLISCRNLLIYLEPALQQRIIPAFHYALKPNGVLMLGTSESVGQFTTLFEPIDKTRKLYVKKHAANWLRFERPPARPITKSLRTTAAISRPAEFTALDAFKEADRITLSKYCPVSVLVAEDGEILQFRGDVHRYFALPSGKATFQLLKMAREGLALPLQKAFHRAKRDNKPVRERGIRFDRRRGVVNLEIVPLRNVNARCFLVLFEKVAAAPKPEPALRANGRLRRNGHANGNGEGDHGRELQQLRHEYAETREHLLNLQEQHDTSVEELQASNEEVQSANEELQSLNEELETSNEELESANEELTTLNEELATRNTELRGSEQRLREQAELLELAPVLARSPKDHIIFWNHGAEKLYGFTKDEALGQASHFLLRAQYPEPLDTIQKELLKRGHWEGEVLHRRKDGQVVCIATQWVVHRDTDQKVRAILEVNSDVTQRKAAEKALRESEQFNRSVLESSPDSIKVLDLAGRILFISPAGLRLMQVREFKQIANLYWPSLWAGEHRAAAEKAYRAALSGETSRFRGVCETRRGTPRWWDTVVQPIQGADGRPERLLVVKRDVTEQRLQEIRVQEEARLATLRAEIAFAVARAGDAQPVYAEIAASLRQHLHTTAVRIWTLPPGAQHLVLQASVGVPGESGEIMPLDRKSPLADAALTQKPLLTNEVATDGSGQGTEPGWLREHKIVGLAAYPLLFEGATLGVVGVYAPHALETRILTELSLASDAVAQYVFRKNAEEERSRLLKEATDARAEVEVLNEMGRTLAAELDLQKLTQAVTDAATQLAKAEFGIFYFNTTDNSGGTYGLHALSGIQLEAFDRFPLSARRAVFAPALEAKTVVRCDDIAKDHGYAHNGTHSGLPVDQIPVKSYLAVPVISRSGDVIGALFFGHSKPNVFSPREERLVVSLASQAAIAMDNARLVENLESNVRERTARLQDTISELQAFSYTVSHDLRAPLRAMQSYAQVLVEDCGNQLDGQAREYLSRIEHAGMRLDRLIQDVLTYSRIARAEIMLQPLDIVPLLEDIAHQYPTLKPPAAEIRIVSPLPVVLAEPSSATQCFSNLLGNAVKFVPKDRKPVITVRAEPLRKFTRIWIEDNGIGISPGDHERIFKMFERVDHAGLYEGTGIGLAIVRKAIERMGGRVGVESDVGQGSRFWLDFQTATP